MAEVPPTSAAPAAPGGPRPARRTGLLRLFLALKLAVSALLLYWVLNRANLSEVWVAARAASIPLLLAAYSLDFVLVLIASTRWRGLLRAHGFDASPGLLIQSYLVAIFFNNFLPSTVGGDASRAYDLYRTAPGKTDAMASVVVDRLLGLLALLLFAVASMPLARQLVAEIPGLPLWVDLGAVGLLVCVWVVFFGVAIPRGQLPPRLPGPIRKVATKVLDAFAAYRGERGVLAVAFGLSVLLQTCVILRCVLISLALGLPVPIEGFFLIVPLATVVMMLPIAINGIGLRENVFALLLAVYGVGNSEAVAYSWLIYLSSLIPGVVGGVLYAMRR